MIASWAGHVLSLGGSTPTPPATLTAPVLTQTTAAGTNPMSWDGVYTDLAVDDVIRLSWTKNGGAATTSTRTVTSDDLLAASEGSFSFSWTAFASASASFANGDVITVKERIERGATVSAYSNILTDTMVILASPPQTSALAYRFDNDNARMKQLITAATAVAADGDVVGYWQNTGTTSRNLVAAANDSTRPTYRVTSGIKEVQFDGTNDILFNLVDPGLWSASGFTAMIAARITPTSAFNAMLAASSTSVNTQFMQIVGTNSPTFANGNSSYRNDSNTNFIANTVNHYTNAHPGTNKVIIVVDDGSGITWYVDGVAGTRQSYTRGANAITLNNLALGAVKRNVANSFAPMSVQGLCVWPGVVLTAPEIAQATTYGGSLQGRTI